MAHFSVKNVKLADFRMKIGRSIPYKISNWHISVKSVKLADFSMKIGRFQHENWQIYTVLNLKLAHFSVKNVKLADFSMEKVELADFRTKK